MKISYNWIKDYLSCDLSPEKMGEILTDTGLEVEGIEKYESIPGGLEGLVIGHVKHVEKHPDADKLNITQVDLGAEELSQIVCGAPNVAEGQKVVVAVPGNTIFPSQGDPFKIKKAKIRGVESLGMICAEDEIGLGKGHDGIMVLEQGVQVGTLAAEYFEVENDFIFEIGLTPNRADGMSHIGCAKEIAAYLKTHENFESDVTEPMALELEYGTQEPLSIKIHDADACPRYAGMVIEGVEVKDSPDWLKTRIESIGLRSINNIVDITNYVLWEKGQALHAFDMNQVGSEINVQFLSEGTEFQTLDEENRKLRSEDLMICNAEDGMCIAGVMGGAKSGVKESTSSIFLESAYFHPTYIRKTSTKHNLRTDAAARYEKGADINMVIPALERAASLILHLAGGKIVSKQYDLYPEIKPLAKVDLTWNKLNGLIGQEIARDKVEEILTTLDFEMLSVNEEGISVAVPSSRPDVKRPADVVEEVLRIYGFNNIDLPGSLQVNLTHEGTITKHQVKNQLADTLVGQGYFEMQNTSLTNSDYLKNVPFENIVPVMNYSSADLDILRPTMLFSALDTVRWNVNRRSEDLKLFEFGKTYSLVDGEYQEKECFSMLITGRKESENWNSRIDEVDFYTLKGMIHQLMAKVGVNRFQVAELNDEIFDYGMSYIIRGKEDKELVHFGLVNAEKASAFGVSKPVFFANFDLEVLLSFAMNQKIKFTEISKFPSSRRDLALLVDKSVRFEDLKAVATKTDKKILKSVGLFDVYQGENLPEGKKSYALSFVFQDTKNTITDKAVDKVMSTLIDKYSKDFGAELR